MIDKRTTELTDMAGIADARLDLERDLRCGFPEVIFALGKTAEQVARIGAELFAQSGLVLATRVEPEQFAALQVAVPAAVYHRQARLAVARHENARNATKPPPPTGHIVVASAGTADMPVSEEAALTCETYGAQVTRLYDVGVAGVHRTLAHTDLLRDARVIIAVAGMEGALPTLIAGLVKVPVIAVPTSIGYGANFDGIAPLLTMLNSCAGGVSVVNIDNGFGAAVLAVRINDPAWTHAEECVQK
jgi:NCAIR mutase (PurE)-related protein